MKPLTKIVIVGGGTSGWLAAAMLCHHLKRHCEIHLIESEELGTIGIGESTVPPFVGLIKRLGIDEQSFMQATQATFKLGIQFVGWHQRNDTYFHPFGVIGQPIGQHDFYQCWLKARAQGDGSSLQEFSPCSVMAQQGRFFHPAKVRNTPIGGANYAMHVDAALVARYLRQYAEAKGLIRTQGKVMQVHQRADGFISSVALDDGRQISGEFFIDCTGFKALLMDNTLGVKLNDWSKWLLCNRAITIKSAHAGPIQPFTRATAQPAGWSWRIPLMHRVGEGYVYSDSFCDDNTAKSTLMRQLDGALLEEPRVIPFTTGHRQQLWKHNCLSLGLAAGFIEPLESTAIHLITRGIDFFLRYFPDQECSPALCSEYNRRMIADFEEIRDFIVLHYCSTKRDDSPFWRACQHISLPDSLRERIDLFREHGTLRDGVDELFRSTSWQSVFEGMGIRPRKYCPRIESMDYSHISSAMKVAKAAINGMVAHLPTHDQALGLVP
jgi:tryptophan halogenase